MSGSPCRYPINDSGVERPRRTRGHWEARRYSTTESGTNATSRATTYPIAWMSSDPVPVLPMRPPEGATRQDDLAQLKLLGELHESGVLDDDEFAREKRRILDR